MSCPSLHVSRVVRPSPGDSEDSRSALAIAYAWAWRVIVISLEMVIPGLVGYWVDSRLGTKALFVVLGFLLGMAVGGVHLVQIARRSSGSPKGGA